MYSRFFAQHYVFEIHNVVAYLSICSYLLPSNDCIVNISQFVHSPIDRHLDCFPFFDIMNKAIMNILEVFL